MLKTYGDDFNFARRLLESYSNHNIDGIPLFMVVPKSDVNRFQSLEYEGVSLIAEETIPCRRLPPTLNPRESGYTNSSVFKLAFHRLGLTDNYLCLDSDGVFIRDFTLEDFFHHDGLPFTVLVEDKLLQSDPEYYAQHWVGRQEDLEGIAQYLKITNTQSLKTCHGFQIFQSRVLENFEKKVLSAPKGRPDKQESDFVDLISLFAYETTWYNYFLQITEPVIHEIEPLFPYVHSGRQLVEFQLFDKTNDDLAKGYIGVVVNGNFQHFSWLAELGKSRIRNAVAYITTRQLLRISGRFVGALFIRLLVFPVLVVRRIYNGLRH